MPPARRRVCPAADSVAVLAFLLRAAEMPAGPTALPTDRAQLAEITFERRNLDRLKSEIAAAVRVVANRRRARSWAGH